MKYKNIIIFSLSLLLIGFLVFPFNRQKETTINNNQNQSNSLRQENRRERGEIVSLVDGRVLINVSEFQENEVRFFNTNLLNKTIYFFIAKDSDGIYRAAANECQVCFAVKTGFRQEGDEMVCNNCGNRYPINRLATERGGCNPAPINPNLEVKDGVVEISQDKLETISYLF